MVAYSFMADGEGVAPRNGTCGLNRLLTAPLRMVYRVLGTVRNLATIQGQVMMMAGAGMRFHAILDTACTHSCAGED